MTDVMTRRSGAVAEKLEGTWEESSGARGWLTTVDHKLIGRRYLFTALVFFLAGGIEALLIRGQLARPDSSVLGPELYNQLFTMHGVTMIFLFITPAFSGLGNFLIPLMIGARDMAFPRLNAFGYWVFLFAGVFLYTSLISQNMPHGGWFNYVPLTGKEFSPGDGIAFYAITLIFLGISTTVGAINFIVTILRLRAPGMAISRMPIYAWSILVTAFIMLFAIPVLTAANVLLLVDRSLGGAWFDAGSLGQPLLWQHLFWVFGHPDVYLIFLPATGIISSIIPVFSQHAIVGYTFVVVATVLTAVISFGVWVHHMFATGIPPLALSFFAGASMVIAVPSGVQMLAWLMTMVQGRVRWDVPMMFALGFLVTFVIGGVSGVMFPVIAFDWQVTDTYFVVAHFHYVLFGGAVFPLLAGLYFWWPKITGRLPNAVWGHVSFWLVFVGFNATFFPMHVLGLGGEPRRTYTYGNVDGQFGAWNLFISVASLCLTAGLALFFANLANSFRVGAPAGRDPWLGESLEWSTPSPPPAYNFTRLPVVRGRSPMWEGENVEAGPVLAEDHQTLSTDALTGAAAERLMMPASSWSPLLVALAMLLTCYAVLFEQVWVVAVGAVLVAAATALWHREPVVTT